MGVRSRQSTVDLNSANEDELARLPMFGREIASEVVHRRPFKSWEDFKQALALDEDLANLLRKRGATLGAPGESTHPHPPLGTRRAAKSKRRVPAAK